jgi:ankyrin repeat protein
MYNAIVSDDDDALRALAAKSSRCLTREVMHGSGSTPLHLASMLGSLACLAHLLDAAPSSLTTEDTNGRFPLAAAVHKGQAEAVRLILAALLQRSERWPRLCVNKTDKAGRSCVHLAVRHDALILPLILPHVQDVGAIAKPSGLSALHMACACGAAEAVGLLVAAGADVNGSTDDGEKMTPMMLACREGHRRLAKSLCVDAGALVGATDATGATAAHWAAMMGLHGLARFLLAQGGAALASAADDAGKTVEEWLATVPAEDSSDGAIGGSGIGVADSSPAEAGGSRPAPAAGPVLSGAAARSGGAASDVVRPPAPPGPAPVPLARAPPTARATLRVGGTSLPIGHSLSVRGPRGLRTERPLTSPLFARLDAFLPRMERANAALQPGTTDGGGGITVERVVVDDADDAAGPEEARGTAGDATFPRPDGPTGDAGASSGERPRRS